MSPHARTDRNLLFGILALQMDFIDRDALVVAMHAWVLDKAKPLGRILVEQRALAEEEHDLLEALVRKHLQRHGDDPQRSLAAVSSLGSARQQLQQIADGELHQSLAHVAAHRADEDDLLLTRPPSVGAFTSAGLRFRRLRPHAKGGLGEVFVALDEELHREVALKEIQDRHADNSDSRARFLLEAEITGGLEHPGIVPVYGLGKYADGRPDYAMRFIPGDSLHEAIARFHKADTRRREVGERALALRQLLGRFVDVCDAIAYAHSRGVLHRDLKPGNVMLGPYGETLVVDWGLAKAIGSQTTEENGTVLERPLQPQSGGSATPTQMGAAVGTPAYMPPEQAAGRLDQLGPASDVYGLGAMLYALLTGKAPVMGGELGEVLRKVQAGDFPRPRQVKRDVPAALEAVCLKAMALKPEERYPTPRALAADVERWLANEPVSAWREPWSLRVRRWVGRHRALVSTAAAVLLVATVGLTAATVLLQEANKRERQETLAKEAALRDAESNAAEAKRQEKEAKAQAEIAQAVNDFLQDDLLSQADSEVQADRHFIPDPDVKVRTLLDRAAAGIDRRFADKPLVAAAIRTAIGDAYQDVGEYPRAIKHLSVARDLRVRHLGPDHADTLTTLNNLALAYMVAGRTAEAIKLFEQVREARTKKLGADHPDTQTTLGNLAYALQETKQFDRALPLYRQVLDTYTRKLPKDHPVRVGSLALFGLCLLQAGKPVEAEPLLRECLTIREKKQSDEWTAFNTRSMLGEALLAQKKYTEAEPLLMQGYEGMKARQDKIPAQHKVRLTEALERLVRLYDATGKKDKADEYRKKLEAERAKSSPKKK